MPAVSLHGMPREVMLILCYPSSVTYFNQDGAWQNNAQEIEGVLAPLEMSTAGMERIMTLSYTDGIGISAQLADEIDAVLLSERCAQFLKVDRARLTVSSKTWVYVIAETKGDVSDHLFNDYLGSAYEFGTISGVLTWPNRDR